MKGFGQLMNVAAREALGELEKVSPESPATIRLKTLLEVADETGIKPSGRMPNLSAQSRREKQLEKIAQRDKEDAEVKRLYEAGLSLIEVGKRMGGHSTAWVTASLYRTRTPTRPRGNNMKRADPERIERFRAMRAAGKTLEEIGAAEHISRERVRQICASAGIDTSPNLDLTDRQKAAVAEYLAGDSLNEVAVRYEVGTSAVRNWIIRAGHVPRLGARRTSPEVAKRAERAAELYRQGKTSREIAKAIGLAKPEQIYRFLAIAGVHPNRNRGVGNAHRAVPL